MREGQRFGDLNFIQRKAMPSKDYLLPGPLLFWTLPADYFCETWCPEWRTYIPSFLGNPETGLLRHRCLDLMREWYGQAEHMTFSEFREQHAASDNTFQVALDFLRADNTKLHNAFYPISLCMILPVLVMIFRYMKHTLCLPYFSSVGRRIGRATHGEEWENKNEERIYKFGEYVFRLCYHSLISVYGLYYLCYLHSEWWTDTSLMFGDGLYGQYIDNAMIWYYLIQTAYNVEALVNIFELSFTFRNPLKHGFGWGKCMDWAPTVRGDFREMFIHHLATNALVMLSSSFLLHRPGAVILFLHDISDVPVDLSKLANFVKWKKTTIVFFVTMVLVWFVARLILLPCIPGYSIVFQCPDVLKDPYNMEPSLLYSVYWIFCSLCALMLFLHVTWFMMFIKMGYVLVSKGEAHDLSEHKNGEKGQPSNGAQSNGHSKTNGTTSNGSKTNGHANGHTTTNGQTSKKQL